MKNSNAVLQVPNFQQEDAGTYECIAENRRGKNVARGRISFHAKPQWFQTMKDTALAIEERLYWECRANGKPKPSYIWLKNGQQLLSEDRIHVEDGVLSVSVLTLSDAGMYQCVAENKHGIIYFAAELMVLASPPDFTGNVLRALLKAKAGTTVTLDCKPKAYPTASILWKKGNLPIHTNDRITLSPDGTLRLANLSKSDAGSYTCFARNRFGMSSTTGRLLVTDPTRIIQGPVDMEIIAVDTVPEVINGNMLTATVVDLNAWVEYEFRVLAKNSVGVGEPSPVSVKTRTEDAVPDAAPGDVGGGGGSRSELVITWEPVPEELQNGESFGYIIAFRAFGEVSWTHVATSAPGASRYVYRNESIAPFSPFHVKVGTYNSKGQGPFSPVVTIYSAETEPSGMPAGVWARSVSASEIEVNWQALPITPERVLGYEVVYWEDDTKPETMGKVRVHWNHTSVTVHSLAGNTQYFLTVSAFNTAGTGPFLPAINVTTKKPPPAQPPLNVEWTLIGSQLSLYWEPVVAMESESEVTGYQLSYWRQRHKEVNTFTTANSTAELSLAENDDDYIIRIQTLSEGGLGPASDPIQIHKLSMSARGSKAWSVDVSPLSLLLTIAISTFRSTL
uniref:Contactin 3 (Plasmacytoma associated) n=1 Tax=Nothobranchius kuhntae TaxID=321403 RepID=A0A1A8I5F0_NOTKU